MKKLKTLDLFSGIGGFALALRDFTETVAYCDIDPDCQDVLRKLMLHKKEIPRAPIFSDVEELARHPDMMTTHGTVDLVVGGFPCQDISVMNHHGPGIFGARSRLFFDALRIAQAKQASFLFFENSPNLINRGLDDVKDALRRFGYPRYVCGVFSASGVGAPHARKRLYILATRKDERGVARVWNKIFPASDASSPPTKSWWKTHPFPSRQARLVPKTRESMRDLRKRGMMLGNAVVPACAHHAFKTLLGALAEPSPSAGPRDVILQDLPMKDASYAFRMVVPPHKFICTEETRVPVFEKTQWSTPVRNEWRTSCTCVGSLRATRILPNQIMYDPKSWRSVSTKRRASKSCDDWIVNPRFIEWLMGFPRDWTA